jgi:hypothetical protein
MSRLAKKAQIQEEFALFSLNLVFRVGRVGTIYFFHVPKVTRAFHKNLANFLICVQGETATMCQDDQDQVVGVDKLYNPARDLFTPLGHTSCWID